MGIGNWKRKWDALRVKMAGQPRLELVKPRRASGPIPRLPDRWHEPEMQRKLFGLDVCQCCGQAQLPGEPLHAGLCGPCQLASEVPEQPPAA